MAQGSPQELMDQTGSTNLRDTFHRIMESIDNLTEDERISLKQSFTEKEDGHHESK